MNVIGPSFTFSLSSERDPGPVQADLLSTSDLTTYYPVKRFYLPLN